MTNSLKPVLESIKDFVKRFPDAPNDIIEGEQVNDKMMFLLSQCYKQFRTKSHFDINNFNMQLRVLNLRKTDVYHSEAFNSFEYYVAKAFYHSYMYYGYKRTKEHMKHGSLFNHINTLRRKVENNETEYLTSFLYDIAVLWGVDLFFHVNMQLLIIDENIL